MVKILFEISLRILGVVLIIFHTQMGLGQTISDSPIQSLSIHQNNVKVVCNYGNWTIKPHKNVTYFWTKYRKIHSSQGGYSGSLLCGKYEEFSISGQLHKLGAFKKGYKIGEWLSWYENGKLSSVDHWKRGMQNGGYVKYFESGLIKERGKYKRGTINGKVTFYDKNQQVTKKKFRHGMEVLKKKKKSKIERTDQNQKKRIKKIKIIPMEPVTPTDNERQKKHSWIKKLFKLKSQDDVKS